MPEGIVTKEDFDKIGNTDIKLSILFETVIGIQQDLREHIVITKKRLVLLERTRLSSKIYALAGGIVGGALAWIGVNVAKG